MKNALSAAALAVLLAACAGGSGTTDPNHVTVAVSADAAPAFYKAAQIASVETAIVNAFGAAGIPASDVGVCFSHVDLVIAAPQTDWSVADANGRTTITVPSDYDPAVASCLETGAFPGLLYDATRACLGASNEEWTTSRAAYVAWVAGATCY